MIKLFRSSILAAVLLFAPSSAFASSLFFAQNELRTIEDQVRKSPQLFSERTKYQFYLGSILYFGEGNWVVWAQGEKWTPEKQHETITIKSVTSNHIYLSLKLRNGKMLDNIALAPNQSLNLLTGRITEGE